METRNHIDLKRLALAWLSRIGCRAVAAEVRGPLSKWRIDAAGWCEAASRINDDDACADPTHGPRRETPRTIIIECKQSRSDFLKDDENYDTLIDQQQYLLQCKADLENGLIRDQEPELRCGDPALFPACESWDFASSRSSSYRRLLRQLARIQKRLHGNTKFHMLGQYRLADHMFLLCPHGMIRPRELPEHWGLLECPRRELRIGIDTLGPEDELPVIVSRAAPVRHSPDHRRQAFLRNIAVSASRDAMKWHSQFVPGNEGVRFQ